MCFQISTENGTFLGFGAWVIPDSVTHYDSTRGLAEGEYTLDDIPAGDAVPLYYAMFYPLGIWGFIIANVILLFVCYRCFGIRAIIIALILYPHYLQAMILPSKDMMVLAVYFLAIYQLLRGNWKCAAVIAVGAYFIRDATPLILLPLVVATVIQKKTNIRPGLIIVGAFILGVLIFSNLEGMAERFFVISRNLNVYYWYSSESLKSLELGVIGYCARLFFNLTNQAFRLTLTDNRGYLSIDLIFMYLSGISTLVTFILAAYYLLRSKDKLLKLISTYYMISLIVISINPFVQGRYQFPMSVLSSAFFFRRMKPRIVLLVYAAVVFMSIIGRTVYYFLNVPFPPQMEYFPVDLLELVK